MRYTNLLRCVSAVLMFTLISTNAQSQVDATTDVDVNIYSNRVEADCFFSIGEDEPFSAIHGDCRIFEDTLPHATTLVRGHSYSATQPGSDQGGEGVRFIC